MVSAFNEATLNIKRISYFFQKSVGLTGEKIGRAQNDETSVDSIAQADEWIGGQMDRRTDSQQAIHPARVLLQLDAS